MSTDLDVKNLNRNQTSRVGTKPWRLNSEVSNRKGLRVSAMLTQFQVESGNQNRSRHSSTAGGLIPETVTSGAKTTSVTWMASKGKEVARPAPALRSVSDHKLKSSKQTSMTIVKLAWFLVRNTNFCSTLVFLFIWACLSA